MDWKRLKKNRVLIFRIWLYPVVQFAGKMALFAGAFDERIALTIAQEPGGGGVNAWRVSETLENVETLGRTNYAWFLESMRQFAGKNVNRLPIDHHELAALIALVLCWYLEIQIMNGWQKSRTTYLARLHEWYGRLLA